MDLYQYELIAYDQGFSAVCGIDEAGRGPLAGDVYAAAVILPRGVEIAGVNDSKKLTEKKREALFDEITARAAAYSIAAASVAEIDEMNILRAAMLAMRRAAEGLSVKPDLALGRRQLRPGARLRHPDDHRRGRQERVDRGGVDFGEGRADRYMKELDQKYPEYRFAQHKGYGTRLHYEMLERYGPSPVHRRTFLKKLLK